MKILTEVAATVNTNKDKDWKQVETRLASISAVVDPVVLLRILLHKLSWDLGVVKKARVARKSLLPSNFQKSKSFDRRALPSTVDDEDSKGRPTGGTLGREVVCRLTSGSRHVQIRRVSSLKIDKKQREDISKRHDSTGSKRGLRLPKYIQSIFKSKAAKQQRQKYSEGSFSLNSSDSEAVVQFQKQLQNLPRRETKDPKDKSGSLPRSHTLEESPRAMRRSIDSAKSSNRSDSKEGHHMGTGTCPPHLTNQDSMSNGPGTPKMLNFPQIQIEIRRPSVITEQRRQSEWSTYSYGYSLGSPDSDCMPLLTPPPSGSRKSSGSSASSISMRSSAGGLCFANSPVPSLASDGPYTFRFVSPRRRASTVVGTIPLPRIQAIPASPADPMSPELSALRSLLLSLIQSYSKSDDNVCAALKESGDMLHNVMNNNEDQKIKDWCSNIVQVIDAKVKFSVLFRFCGVSLLF